MQATSDTIAAIATPPGEGGLGVIRLSGPAAVSVAESLFQPLKSLDWKSVPSHTCHIGTIRSQKPIDHAVITLFRAPHSYTGEDVVEFSVHGSPFVLRETLNLCVQHGARLARPGEFTERAFLSGKMDLTQAEAVAELIRAKTDQSHAAAMGQLSGRLAQRIRECRDILLPLLAHVEVGLDHSDEDHTFLNRTELLTKCEQVRNTVDELLASAQVSKILREGLRVAIVGRPNVGKSSLLNALLKEDRAIVTPIPGTTRDTLEEQVDWDGVPVVLTDTAGIRKQAYDPVEKLGIERTQQALAQSDVALCVFDSSQPLTPEDETLVAACSSKPHLWVVNKSDLTASWETAQLSSMNGHAPAIQVSAKTGIGLDALVRAVKHLGLGDSAVAGSTQWMINTRHRQALERAREALNEACTAAQKDAFEECVALELHQALEALGEIIGETTTEDILDQIFSTFCIGK